VSGGLGQREGGAITVVFDAVDRRADKDDLADELVILAGRVERDVGGSQAHGADRAIAVEHPQAQAIEVLPRNAAKVSGASVIGV